MIMTLDERIEIVRNEMIDNGINKGYLHPDTIKKSQELDILILQKQKGPAPGKE